MKKIILLIVFILFIVSIFAKGEIRQTDKIDTISVEIHGEVLNEGSYTMKRGSTLEELFELAETTNNADLTDFLYSDVLYNGQVIVVPEMKENILKVSLNSASIEELLMLPGIGEKTAIKIIEYRKLYSFHSIEEIKNVSGIGEKKYEAIKDFLTL